MIRRSAMNGQVAVDVAVAGRSLGGSGARGSLSRPLAATGPAARSKRSAGALYQRLQQRYKPRPTGGASMASAAPKIPEHGQPIQLKNGRLNVPDHPILPFIEGDGTGPDIWRASVRVLDAAVQKAYGGRRRIQWMEVLAGQKSYDKLGTWLPDETVEAFREFRVGVKGPLTTPVGGGIRSLNVALRQLLDLDVCLPPA